MQLDVSNGNKVVTAGNYYGQEYQLASDTTLTSTNSTTPQTKVSMTTTNLPAGTYRITVHWIWNRLGNNQTARFDLTLNGTPQGTTSTLTMRPTNTADWYTESRNYFANLSGVNTITFRYWGSAVGNSTSVSDATIELIRVK